ncbi:nucleotide sugar dehydrogenase [Paeniroseomonas aquatica]|uniref:nucleotide sugar dehydrogenase n=1 Tax=Paeniroseomonas aquatica TaxID=373043 RepID=UPI003610EA45
MAEADAVLVCVPTPLGRHREPDLTAVEAASWRIARQLRPGQLIVLESTSFPGTTRQVMLPILEATGLRCGTGFFLAHAPEREDPGNGGFRTATIPRVVGGVDAPSLALASALYGAFLEQVVPVASADVAEAAKLTENIFRAVNMALVNELKLVFGAMGIDVWEVIEAARTKPFGYMPFFPGPGLGGHCIPVDPQYLSWQARAHGVPTRFIDLAGEINAAMPQHVLDRLALALDRLQGRGLRGARVLVLGIGYKRNLEDLRESPGLRLMEMLEARGAAACYFDPLVPVIPPWRSIRRWRVGMAWPGRRRRWPNVTPRWSSPTTMGWTTPASPRRCRWWWIRGTSAPGSAWRGPTSSRPDLPPLHRFVIAAAAIGVHSPATCRRSFRWNAPTRLPSPLAARSSAVPRAASATKGRCATPWRGTRSSGGGMRAAPGRWRRPRSSPSFRGRSRPARPTGRSAGRWGRVRGAPDGPAR